MFLLGVVSTVFLFYGIVRICIPINNNEDDILPLDPNDNSQDNSQENSQDNNSQDNNSQENNNEENSQDNNDENNEDDDDNSQENSSSDSSWHPGSSGESSSELDEIYSKVNTDVNTDSYPDMIDTNQLDNMVLNKLWDHFNLETKYREIEEMILSRYDVIPGINKDEWRRQIRHKIITILDETIYHDDPKKYIETKRNNRTNAYALVEDTALTLLEYYEFQKSIRS